MKKDLYLAQRLLEKIIRSITSTYYRLHSIQLIEDAVQQPGFVNTGYHIVETSSTEGGWYLEQLDQIGKQSKGPFEYSFP